jgi:hypothetical protein
LNDTQPKCDIKIFELDINAFEIICCNLGFKNSTCDYNLTIQDDVVIGNEPYFDQRMIKPFLEIPELLAVSSRDAVDVSYNGDFLDFYNVFGSDVNSPRDILGTRHAINRGPLIFKTDKLVEMGYLDETLCPTALDDADISIKSFLQKGWLVGAYVIDFESRLEWGTSRKNPLSYAIKEWSEKKNMKIIIERYKDFLDLPVHDQNIIIK